MENIFQFIFILFVIRCSKRFLSEINPDLPNYYNYTWHFWDIIQVLCFFSMQHVLFLFFILLWVFVSPYGRDRCPLSCQGDQSSHIDSHMQQMKLSSTHKHQKLLAIFTCFVCVSVLCFRGGQSNTIITDGYSCFWSDAGFFTNMSTSHSRSCIYKYIT